MAQHNELGKKGEQMAAEHLAAKGFQILARNWRFLKEELDIVAMKDNRLVIVEVKTRASSHLAGPEETVSRRKQRSLVRAADAFIQERNILMETRFDIISVIHNAKYTKIDHIEDAFYPVA